MRSTIFIRTGFHYVSCCCSCQTSNSNSWFWCKGDTVEQASSCAININATNAIFQSSAEPQSSTNQPTTWSTNVYPKITSIVHSSLPTELQSSLAEDTTSILLPTYDETGRGTIYIH